MASTNAKAKRGVKPGGKLGDLADIRKQEHVLLGDIQAHLLAKSMVPSTRRQDIIHPSEMARADWCHRQTYYRLHGDTPTDAGEKFSFWLQTIFEEGHDIHAKWQRWLSEMGRLWGLWVCTYCEGYSYTGAASERQHCPDCDGLLSYREIPLEAESKYLIAGHADGAVLDVGSLIEIKSIGMGTLRMDEPALLAEYQVTTTDGKKVYDLDALWKALRRPLASHIRQIMIYLALCREMGLPFDRAVFLYEFKANQDVKEFSVRYNPKIAGPLLDKALDVKYALKKGVAPERPEFTGVDTKVCKSCPYLTLCWGKNDAAGAKEVEPVSEDREATRGRRVVTTRQARRRDPIAAGRSYGTRRQRLDDAVLTDDPVA